MTDEKRKSRPTPIRRYANDLVFQPEGEDGPKYYPHYGEYIEFTPHATVSQMIFSERQIDSRSNEQVVEWVADRLVAWTWTDARGLPLPPPSVDTVKRLSMVELIWIMQAFNGLRGQERDEDPLAGENVTSDGSGATEPEPVLTPVGN